MGQMVNFLFVNKRLKIPSLFETMTERQKTKAIEPLQNHLSWKTPERRECIDILNVLLNACELGHTNTTRLRGLAVTFHSSSEAAVGWLMANCLKWTLSYLQSEWNDHC